MRSSAACSSGLPRSAACGAQPFSRPGLHLADPVPRDRIGARAHHQERELADTLIENIDLEGGAADGVRALFASAGEVESAITFLGIGILLVSITSFARSLQSTYERALSSIRAEMQDWAGPVFSATVALLVPGAVVSAVLMTALLGRLRSTCRS